VILGHQRAVVLFEWFMPPNGYRKDTGADKSNALWITWPHRLGANAPNREKGKGVGSNFPDEAAVKSLAGV
jgi:hypothetical protein